jgi:hypothetical protein
MSIEHGTTEVRTTDLSDAQGPIPTFPPRALDEHGRLIPLSDEERRARSEAAVRALKAIRDRPDDDPPGTTERMMRGIDANRPPGRKLFEGMY